MREVCPQAIDLVKQFEGLHRVGSDGLIHAYKDAVGYPTIGFGTLLTKDRNADLARFAPITEAQAEAYLIEELSKCAKSIVRLVNVPLTDEQFGALASFVYNLGAGSLQSSTLRRRLNEGDYDEAADQFLRWVMAGGRVLKGLQRRREAERELFIGAYGSR